jgi:predicted transcriptional regulator
MKVLLSIKPEFAFKIFEGNKRYEFRKAIFKREGITKVIVYASAPISKVIGEFDIAEIIHDELERLWQETNRYAGIDEDYFYQYFAKRETGYAIKICQARLYEDELCIRQHFGLTPPQSFAYVNGTALLTPSVKSRKR